MLKKLSMESFTELRIHKSFFTKKRFTIHEQPSLTMVSYCCNLCCFSGTLILADVAFSYSSSMEHGSSDAINECWPIQLSFEFMKLVTTL